jgi:hypothetical protein
MSTTRKTLQEMMAEKQAANAAANAPLTDREIANYGNIDPVKFGQEFSGYSDKRKRDVLEANASNSLPKVAYEGAAKFLHDLNRGGTKDVVKGEDKTGVVTNNTPVVNTEKEKDKNPEPPKGDFVSGLKDFFWDKDKGGMTTHGLLTLGALARVVSGSREAAAGMKGGGLESANVGTALSGLMAGSNARRSELEQLQLEKDKLKNAKDIANNKADAKAGEPDFYEKQRVYDIKSVMGNKPDFVTTAKDDSFLEQSGFNPKKYPSRYDAWAAYWDAKGSGDSFRKMYPKSVLAKTPAKDTATATDRPNPAGI